MRRHLIRCLVLPLLVHAAASHATPVNGQVQVHIAPGNADKDWMPRADQVARVLEQSRRYFAARDAGRLEEAYRFYAPTMGAQAGYPKWRQSVQAVNDASGGITARRLLRVTWSKDPANARPGVYAAVDFSSTSPQLALHCGYVVWREQDDGSMAIVREEDNVLDKPTYAQVPPQKVLQLRKAMHC